MADSTEQQDPAAAESDNKPTITPAEAKATSATEAGTPDYNTTPMSTPDSSSAALTTSQDVFVNPDIKLLAAKPTMVGRDGVERIAGPSLTDWSPAPLEASEEAKASLEAFNTNLDDAKEQRQNLLAPAADAKVSA